MKGSLCFLLRRLSWREKERDQKRERGREQPWLGVSHHGLLEHPVVMNRVPPPSSGSLCPSWMKPGNRYLDLSLRFGIVAASPSAGQTPATTVQNKKEKKLPMNAVVSLHRLRAPHTSRIEAAGDLVVVCLFVWCFFFFCICYSPAAGATVALPVCLAPSAAFFTAALDG